MDNTAEYDKAKKPYVTTVHNAFVGIITCLLLSLAAWFWDDSFGARDLVFFAFGFAVYAFIVLVIAAIKLRRYFQ